MSEIIKKLNLFSLSQGNKEDVRVHAKDIEAHFEVLISFTVYAEVEKRKANEELEVRNKL